MYIFNVQPGSITLPNPTEEWKHHSYRDQTLLNIKTPLGTASHIQMET